MPDGWGKRAKKSNGTGITLTRKNSLMADSFSLCRDPAASSLPINEVTLANTVAYTAAPNTRTTQTNSRSRSFWGVMSPDRSEAH